MVADDPVVADPCASNSCASNEICSTTGLTYTCLLDISEGASKLSINHFYNKIDAKQYSNNFTSFYIVMKIVH